jgi:hypothetical protein
MPVFKVQTRVVFRDTTRCFWDNLLKKRTRGITTLLRECFYPTYSFYRAKHGEATKGGPKLPGAQGMVRGKLVDEQISAIINGDTVQKKHIFTTFVFNALKKAKFAPQFSQVVVFDETANLATAVDIVCVDENGTPVLIELKCSSDARYNQYSGNMQGAMQHKRNSLANQHVLQAQITRVLWEKTYHMFARSFVLQINSGGGAFLPVPEDNAIAETYHQLIAFDPPEPKRTSTNKNKKKRIYKKK